MLINLQTQFEKTVVDYTDAELSGMWSELSERWDKLMKAGVSEGEEWTEVSEQGRVVLSEIVRRKKQTFETMTYKNDALLPWQLGGIADESLLLTDLRMRQLLNKEIKYLVLVSPTPFTGFFKAVTTDSEMGFIRFGFTEDNVLPDKELKDYKFDDVYMRVEIGELEKYSKFHGLSDEEVEKLKDGGVQYVYMYPVREVLQLDNPYDYGESVATANFLERERMGFDVRLKNSPVVVYGSFYFILPQLARMLDMVPHNRFVEVFSGPGDFSLEKKPVDENIMNDIDSEVLMLFKLLKDISIKEILTLRKKEWRRNKDVWKKLRASKPTEPIEKLYRYFYLARCGDILGKSPASVDKRYFSKFNTGVPKDDAEHGFGKKVRAERLIEQAIVSNAKLQRITFSNQDCMKIVEEFKDDPDALFFCDPPYLDVTFGFGYKTDAKNIDFPKFAKLLQSVKGKWVFLHNAHATIMKLFKDNHLVKFLGVKRPPFFGKKKKKEKAERALYYMFANFDIGKLMKLTDRGFTSGPTTICV